MEQKIIFGAPGCGKTTKLMEILEKELKENEPNKIAYVSFTRKGTYEGVYRAQNLFAYHENDLPFFRTLHSIAFRTGGYSKYDMISKKDYKAFSDAMGMKFTGYYTEEFYHNDDQYLFLDFLLRNNREIANTYLEHMNTTKLKNVIHNYRRFKEYEKISDFTDILQTFVERNEPLPVDIAIIDEAQDLTTLQWKMCEIAFRNCKRIYIAGDDDQAIYEWSGADVNHFLALEGERLILDKSYRLQKKILEVSKNISAQITNRVEKNFEPIADEGNIQYYNSLDEIELDENASYYFLSRNNWFLSKHREYLRNKAQVFYDKEKLSYYPKDIEAINIFEHIRKTRQMSDIEELKLKKYLKPNVNMQLPWFDNFNLPNDDISYYRDLIKYKTNLKDIKITVSTIHGVKGGEADNVVLMLDFTAAVKNSFERNPDSELRCLYVACTRAKKNLLIVHSNSKNGYDNYVRIE